MAETGPGVVLRLISSRNFGPYFFGNAASASGTWFQNLAASLFVFEKTHSPFLLGVLQFANFVPVLLLVPWTGGWSDRFDRRRLLMSTQLVSMTLSAGLTALTWEGHASVALVMACAVGLGVASAVSSPSTQAIVGDLVARDDLQSAVALNSVTFNLARVIGPTLAGLSVEKFGYAPTFAINSGSYLLLVIGLLCVTPHARQFARRGESRLRDSLRLVAGEPRLLAFLLIVAAVGFASDPINTEAPAFAHAFHIHHGLRLWTGVIVGAFGAGAICAAFVLAGRIVGSRRRMTITLVVMCCGVAAFAVSPSFPLGLAFLVVGGFGYLASNTSASSQLQLGVPDHQRGRIMALWSVAFIGLRPVASLTDGAIASGFGVRVAGVVLVLPSLLIAAALYFLRSHHKLLTSRA